jgi:hypothetical protein
MFSTIHRYCGLSVLLFLFVSGCGGDTGRVTGEVTYEGKPVEQGMISFQPADGKGPSAGGIIENGRYTATKVPPGPKVVQIEATPATGSVRISSEERAKAPKSGGKPNRLIPPKAEGNNAKVEIKVGDQKLDFHLKKPSK